MDVLLQILPCTFQDFLHSFIGLICTTFSLPPNSSDSFAVTFPALRNLLQPLLLQPLHLRIALLYCYSHAFYMHTSATYTVSITLLSIFLAWAMHPQHCCSPIDELCIAHSSPFQFQEKPINPHDQITISQLNNQLHL